MTFHNGIADSAPHSTALASAARSAEMLRWIVDRETSRDFSFDASDGRLTMTPPDDHQIDVDLTAGLKQMLLTCVIALVPVAALVGDAFYSALNRGTRANAGASSGSLFIIIVMLSHWYFTGGAAVSALILVGRPVSGGKKMTACVAAGVAVVCSLFLASRIQW